MPRCEVYVLNQAIEAEVAELVARYGQPRRVAVELTGEPFSPINESDRFGEVCMVLRRRSGRLLTAIKTFYPTGAFRLLTGGIHHGEAIEAALLREVEEETSLDVTVARFLAVIEYRLSGEAYARDAHDFATFAFLLDERGGILGVQDPGEQLGEFREITIGELPQVAEYLANLEDGYSADLGGGWRDWGQFRAVVHRVVYEALKDEE